MPATISKPTKVIIIAGQSNATNILGPTKYTFRNTAIVKQLDTNTGAVSAASEPFLSVDSTDSTFFGEMGDRRLIFKSMDKIWHILPPYYAHHFSNRGIGLDVSRLGDLVDTGRGGRRWHGRHYAVAICV